MLARLFTGMVLDWTWEEIIPASGSEPSGNRGGAFFSRDGTGAFVLIGGRTQAGSDRSDLWTFDYGGTNTWTQVVSSGLTNVYSPAGYVSGGTAVIADSRRWDQPSASTTLSKISISTGTQTSLTDSGTGAGTGVVGGQTADVANKTVYTSRNSTTTYVLGEWLTKSVQDLSVDTSTKTRLTSSSVSRLASASLAFYAAENALYTVAPSHSYTGGTWVLDANCIYKYDLTAGTGWVQVTGVTNAAGGVTMPAWPINQNQMLWSDTHGQFFIFVTNATAGVARVLMYDPSTKVLSEALFSNNAAANTLGEYDAYSASRGNAGTVVETAGEFFFITAGASTSITNARIWRFRSVN